MYNIWDEMGKETIELKRHSLMGYILRITEERWLRKYRNEYNQIKKEVCTYTYMDVWSGQNMASSSKKHKVSDECRVFQGRRTDAYLFVEVWQKPVCLVCKKSISEMKEFNWNGTMKPNMLQNSKLFMEKFGVI